MKNNNDDSLRLSPAKNYKPPNLPSLENARDNPELLKALPSRWKKSAAAMACLGFAGMFVLSGCVPGRPHHGGSVGVPIYVACPTETDPWLHHGGDGGGMPFYVASRTESDVYVFMREQLDAANIVRTVAQDSDCDQFEFPPDYFVHFDEQDVVDFIHTAFERLGIHFGDQITDPGMSGLIYMYDADKRVAIGLLPYSNTWPCAALEAFTEIMAQKPGFMYTWVVNHTRPIWLDLPSWPTIDEQRPLMVSDIVRPLDDFIYSLQRAGIIS